MSLRTTQQRSAITSIVLALLLGCGLAYAVFRNEPEPDPKAPQSGPLIDVWYGDSQHFGQNGQPQEWVNILGTVSGPSGVKSAKYSLNGGAPQRLSLGPQIDNRLVGPGDFNVELDYSALSPGANTVDVIAVDKRNRTSTHRVNITYTKNANPPRAYHITWSADPDIQSMAQVVDGKFAVQADGTLRTMQVGYDRIIAIGDMNTWKDYTVLTDFTLHRSNFNEYAVGIMAGWRGHSSYEYGWRHFRRPYPGHPFPAWGSYLFDSQPREVIVANTPNREETILVATERSLPLETREMVRFKIEQVNPSQSRYFLRIWPAATEEPVTWDVLATSELARGSLLLAAHQADVSWGDVTVTPGPRFDSQISFSGSRRFRASIHSAEKH